VRVKTSFIIQLPIAYVLLNYRILGPSFIFCGYFTTLFQVMRSVYAITYVMKPRESLHVTRGFYTSAITTVRKWKLISITCLWILPHQFVTKLRIRNRDTCINGARNISLHLVPTLNKNSRGGFLKVGTNEKKINVC
jgi:hypothetical protein